MDNPEQGKTKKNKTICVVQHYAQANTNNVNKTWTLLLTTGCKDEPNIVLCGNSNAYHNTELRTKRQNLYYCHSNLVLSRRVVFNHSYYKSIIVCRFFASLFVCCCCFWFFCVVFFVGILHLINLSFWWYYA